MENVIGSNIKRFRIKKGLTQAQLSAMVDGVFGQGNISQYEAGYSLPSAMVLKQIADALGVRIDALFRKVKCVDYETKKKSRRDSGVAI